MTFQIRLYPFLIAFFCLFINNHLWAQKTTYKFPVSIGYLGQAAIQPGVKLGTEFSVNQWESRNSKIKSFYVSPQLGFFTRPGVSTNFLPNLEVGLRKVNASNRASTALSIGLGYLMESRITSFNINLGNGEIEGQNRDTNGFLLPTINFEIAGALINELDWYSKLSYGTQISTDIENTGILFVELGMKFYLKK